VIEALALPALFIPHSKGECKEKEWNQLKKSRYQVTRYSISYSLRFMIVTIQLSDEQAAALQAKAAAQGFSLERWLQSLAEQEAQVQVGSVVAEMRSLRARVKPDPEGWTTRDYVNFGRRSQ